MTTAYNVEINGIPLLTKEGTFRRSTATQFAQKIGQGDTKHQDFTTKSVITQDTFHGGRGDKTFSDPSRFFDSENVQSRIKRQVTLSPKATAVGLNTAAFPEYETTAVDSEVLTSRDTTTPTERYDTSTAVYGANKVGIDFTQTNQTTISGFSLLIARDTANTGRNIKAALFTGATAPTSPVSNATSTVPWASVPTSKTWVRFQFAAGVTLSASTKYWIVVEEETGTAVNPRYHVYGMLMPDAPDGTSSGNYNYNGTSWTRVDNAYAYKFGCVRRMLSQKFTVGAADRDVTYLQLKLRLTGTRPSTARSMTVRLETDNAGSPSGTLVTDTGRNASWTISTADLSTSWGMVKTNIFTTANHITLAATTAYHIVIYRPDDDNQDDDSWDLEWANDGVGTAYAGAAAYKDYPTDTWHAVTGDFAFRVETGLAQTGLATCFCHFYGKVYAAVGNKLYSLAESGDYWTLVQYGSSPYEFPAPIKDLIAYNAAGTDNQQVITGTATGGGWDLTFDEKTVSNINWDSSAWGLQGHFENDMDNKVHVGDVTCEGGPLGASPITCTFSGQYSSGKVPLITVASNATSPLTGGTVTVTAPESYMFIALGNNTPMVRMKSDGTFTTGTSPKAKLFGTLRQRLYAVKKASLMYNVDGQVADANWSTSAHVGNASSTVNGIAELDGVLYIAKEDGLYKLLSDQEAMCVVPWHDLSTPLAGKSMKAWQGSLIIPVGHSLMRFTTGQITPMGLDMDEGLPDGKLGKVVSIVSTLNTLYVGVEGDDDNYCSIWEYNGTGWHNLWTAPEKTKQLGAMAYTSTFGDSHRLWFAWGDSVYYMTIPGVTDNPANWMDDNGAGLASFCDSGYLETGWIEAGLPEVTKSWINLATDTEVPAGSQIDVYYTCDESTEYRLLSSITANGVSKVRFPYVRNLGGYKVIAASATPTTTVFDVADNSGIVAGDLLVIRGHERLVSSVATHTVSTVDYDQITLSAGMPVAPEVGDLVFSAGRAGKKIRLKFVLSTTNATKTPILRRWTLGLLARPETTWAWQFQVRVQAVMEHLDGTGDYIYTLDQVIDNLRIPCDTPMPVDFKDPDGNSYEVFMTSQVEQERNTFLDDEGNEQMERIVSVALIELE